MSKKHFIALAETIKFSPVSFSPEQIEELIRFCRSQNSNFNAARFRSFIKGECGPCGGAR